LGGNRYHFMRILILLAALALSQSVLASKSSFTWQRHFVNKQ
jgi:hypothetical protein